MIAGQTPVAVYNEDKGVAQFHLIIGCGTATTKLTVQQVVQVLSPNC